MEVDAVELYYRAEPFLPGSAQLLGTIPVRIPYFNQQSFLMLMSKSLSCRPTHGKRAVSAKKRDGGEAEWVVWFYCQY